MRLRVNKNGSRQAVKKMRKGRGDTLEILQRTDRIAAARKSPAVCQYRPLQRAARRSALPSSAAERATLKRGGATKSRRRLMQEQQPSRTALGAAAYRAAHQHHDAGRIFYYPLARVVLGLDADRIIAELANDPASDPLRLFIAARSRFAEDCLAAAAEGGIRQAVVLGAGLDTMALRQPNADVGVRIYEVDHPATQQWKRNRLAEAGLTAPANVAYVAVDFEKDDLASALAMAGFRKDMPAFFTWLGVVPYLHRDTVITTLRTIADARNSEIVFDYTEPLE